MKYLWFVFTVFSLICMFFLIDFCGGKTEYKEITVAYAMYQPNEIIIWWSEGKDTNGFGNRRATIARSQYHEVEVGEKLKLATLTGFFTGIKYYVRQG